MIAGALAVLNALYGFFVLPESLPRERRITRIVWARANPVGALKLLRSHPELSGLSVVYFLFQFAHYVLPRSEEHTSELQSLMRISYAVFCLKKKKKNKIQKTESYICVKTITTSTVRQGSYLQQS